MSGILEVYLWLVIGKNIRNNSGNCHIVGIDQTMMSPTELLKRSLKRYENLPKMSLNICFFELLDEFPRDK